jgi:hypothetical protein
MSRVSWSISSFCSESRISPSSSSRFLGSPWKDIALLARMPAVPFPHSRELNKNAMSDDHSQNNDDQLFLLRIADQPQQFVTVFGFAVEKLID